MDMDWSLKELNINGLKLITPFYREDNRGYFLKAYEHDIFCKMGYQSKLSEAFETFSKHSVIRGMHFQTNKPQAKMIRVLEGEIYDVALDLREHSDTFGQWEAVVLSNSRPNIFYIPEGFAHGFQVLSPYALVLYQCIGEYLPDFDTGIYYKDTDLNINWPIHKSIVSDKDNNLMKYKDFIVQYGSLKEQNHEKKR